MRYTILVCHVADFPVHCKLPIYSRLRRSVLGVHWKDWCWSWNSPTLATSCKELTHWKRPWCWEGLGAGGEGDDRGWDGWMASLTRWTWVWVNFGSWWWTGRPGMLRFMGSQRVGHYWTDEFYGDGYALLAYCCGGGNSTLLQNCCLENPMDRGAW